MLPQYADGDAPAEEQARELSSNLNEAGYSTSTAWLSCDHTTSAEPPDEPSVIAIAYAVGHRTRVTESEAQALAREDIDEIRGVLVAEGLCDPLS